MAPCFSRRVPGAPETLTIAIEWHEERSDGQFNGWLRQVSRKLGASQWSKKLN
jgi:hypothetical protein